MLLDDRRHHCLSQSYPTKFPKSASATRFFLIFIAWKDTIKMLFMVVPLLGVDFKPAAGLDYYFAFSKPNRGRVDESGTMAEKKSRYYFLFRKMGGGGGKNTKKMHCPVIFCFSAGKPNMTESSCENGC